MFCFLISRLLFLISIFVPPKKRATSVAGAIYLGLAGEDLGVEAQMMGGDPQVTLLRHSMRALRVGARAI
jgi:hypothetical protein